MDYVFDNNTLTAIFRHYFFDRFPTFWDKFNGLLQANRICSVREVKKEIEEMNRNDQLEKWVKRNPSFFKDPTVEEMKFVAEIFSVRHYQQSLERRKLIKGGPFADPFIIAKAKIEGAIVISQEQYKSNAVKIPNICKHYGIECLDLEGFLTREKWSF